LIRYGKARAKRSYPEHELQVRLVKDLRRLVMPGILWFSVPNGDVRTVQAGARLKAEGLRAGIPDLIFIRFGRVYGLELKALKGKQSPSQAIIEMEWLNAGGIYELATGYTEAINVLTKWEMIRPVK